MIRVVDFVCLFPVACRTELVNTVNRFGVFAYKNWLKIQCGPLFGRHVFGFSAVVLQCSLVGLRALVCRFCYLELGVYFQLVVDPISFDRGVLPRNVMWSWIMFAVGGSGYNSHPF